MTRKDHNNQMPLTTKPNAQWLLMTKLGNEFSRTTTSFKFTTNFATLIAITLYLTSAISNEQTLNKEIKSRMFSMIVAQFESFASLIFQFLY